MAGVCTTFIPTRISEAVHIREKRSRIMILMRPRTEAGKLFIHSKHFPIAMTCKLVMKSKPYRVC